MKQCPFFQNRHYSSGNSVNRREFLYGVSVTASGLAIASCAPQFATQSSGSNAIGQPVVAIAKASRYDLKGVKQQVQKMLDEIGGIADVISHGKRVAIKVNLMGGTPILTDIDACVSVSKMKCHNTAGVTHTMKNLFGTDLCRYYTLSPQDD